jgi:O-antigen/teichoic acid export membrane protein
MSIPPRPFKWLKTLLKEDSLKARTARSAFWTFGSTISSQIMRLASNLILTRLLFPEAFGLMALVQVVLTGLAMFSDTGIRASIIQSDRGHDPAFLDTAWTIQVLRGGILWLVACGLALPMAWFYDNPMLAQLLPVAGFALVIKGLAPTRLYTASRDLRIGKQTRISGVSQAIGLVLTVGLTWILQSVWALVISTILTACIHQIMLARILPGTRNRFCFEREAAGELFHFGKWIFLSTAFGFLVNHADRLILGKFVTLEMLGIYMVAFLLGSVPLLLGRPLAGKILFPLYKQRPPWESPENQRKIFRLRRMLTAGLLTLSTVLALGGDLAIRILYDPRYELAGPMLVLLAVAQLPIVILVTYDQILLAAGDSQRFMTRVGATAIVQTAVLFLGVTLFGILGAILAPGIAAILVYPLLVSAIRRYQGWDPLHDAVAAVAALVIGALALWVHWDVLMDLGNRIP